jgi:hypothetical protein
MELIAPAVAIVGIVLGWWLSRIQSAREWKRQDKTRFHGERRALYAAYVDAIDQVEVAARTWQHVVDNPADEWREPGYRWPDPREARALTHKAVLKVDEVRRQIDLIASTAVRTSAEEVWNAVIPCGPRGHDQRPDLSGLRAARDDFRSSARAALGVAD